MLPGKNCEKSAIWCILSVLNYDIINLKINNFTDNKATTTNNFRHSFLFNHKGCLVHQPPRSQRLFFKKIKQNGGFSFKVFF